MSRTGPTLRKKIKELEERRVIIVQMEPTQVSVPGDPGRYIYAKVRFENVGNRTELIYWPSEPFKVSRVWIDERNTLKVEQLGGVRTESLPGSEAGLRLMPGVVVNRVFMARVEKPGLYYLELDVAASPEEQEQAQAEGLNASVSWREVAQITIK